MPIEVILIDPDSNRKAKIGPEGQLETVQHAHPPQGEQIAELPFRQYFTDDGTPTGSNDMRVNGSVDYVDFYVSARNDVDVYIATISVLISDSSATLSKFGNLTALTNGVQVIWSNQTTGAYELHDGIKTNFDFVRFAGGVPSFGDGATAFIASNVSGNAEGFIPTIHIPTIFTMKHGLRLTANTQDKLIFRIRDNLSIGMDAFNIVSYGKTLDKEK